MPTRPRPSPPPRTALVAGGAAIAVLLIGLGVLELRDVVGMARATITPVASVAPQPAAPAQQTEPPPAPSPAPEGPFVVKSILPIKDPIKFGQFYWDESQGEPGPVVITVDLTARVLSVFENGHEIGASAILKGYGDKPTPTGVFPITQKDAHHVSNIYDAPMPWMLRLTNDGITIHGSKVELGYATNGCVGVPEAFAQKLFRVAHLGDKVIITDGKRLSLGEPIIK